MSEQEREVHTRQGEDDTENEDVEAHKLFKANDEDDGDDVEGHILKKQ